MKDDKELLQVGSLQNPVLSQTLAFEVAKRKEFVQILHQGVTIIGSQLQSLVLSTLVYESMTADVHGLLENKDKKVIASILQADEKEVIIEYANNQVS